MVALYGQPTNTSLKAGRCIYKTKEIPKPMVLLATTANMCQHVLSAHLEVVLWNATRSTKKSVGITNDRWVLNCGIPIPVVANQA